MMKLAHKDCMPPDEYRNWLGFKVHKTHMLLNTQTTKSCAIKKLGYESETDKDLDKVTIQPMCTEHNLERHKI